ncbi:MAG: thioredoxin domain-containing protein [Gammaproteobacteria bacterium]|nr:thioredoxin domain-containing protein [Gammaproteobacteria bacterium]
MNDLEAELRKLEQSKQGGYDKRTEHLDGEGVALFINRLIREDSPYLLQHAHNPVNWYPWGAEAFEHAREQNKPVFLSIGYSTCHWCHVMEVESFDNVDVAAVLNQGFICIKMDREQYPDIDEVYMTGVQLVSGQGGWPMSSFLLADGKPFFGATYFPAASFISLLNQISEAWKTKYAELESTAQQIAVAIDRILGERKKATSLAENIIENTVEALSEREDRSYGGLSGEPKFPQEPLLLLLLDHIRRERDEKAMGFVDRALEGMGRGGVYDQIAGGFHRYSVDERWLVPHFEKMLYNQSQLALVYLQAYELSGQPFFRRICEMTLDYVARDMQLSEGGFYSATDADSEGEEGTFFTWSLDELREVLDVDEMQLVNLLYAPSVLGNFEGSNILNLSKSLEEFAAEAGIEEFTEKLDGVLQKLYLAREKRIHPLVDDKLIVAWAAAMMTAFVKAATALGNEDYLNIARKAAAFVWGNNVDEAGYLKRIYLDGTVSIAGQLEDYANFAEALIALYDVTNEAVYLQQAQTLMTTAIAEFWDEGNDGFFLSPTQQTGPQLTRSRNASDGAIFSPAATALHCLLQLARRNEQCDPATSESEQALFERIDRGIGSLLGHINDSPMSHPSMLRLISDRKDGSRDRVQWIEGGKAKISCRRMLSTSEQLVQIEIEVMLSDNWHVTAQDQAVENFSPIVVSLGDNERHWTLMDVSMPKANGQLQVGSVGSVAIYKNSFNIEATIQRNSMPDDRLCASAELQIKLQLCSDLNCLLPQSVRVRI